MQWQVSTDGGAAWANVAGATSGTYNFSAVSTENSYEYQAVFTNVHGGATTDPATLTVAGSSGNWSGQVDTGGIYGAVSGSWTVPGVSCGPSDMYSSVWVGIDGDGSDTVEQDGTEEDCFDGIASYNAWYEMYGDDAVNRGDEVPLADPVAPGDSMSASVSVAPDGTWTLAIADTTEDWGVSKLIAAPGTVPSQVSAEWIVERPELCSASCSLSSLADFGTASFTSATASVDGTWAPASQLGDQVIDMVEGPDLLAAAYTLDASGEDFTDLWRFSG